MRFAELAKRNLKTVWRDPLSLGLTVALPAVLLVVLQALGGVDSFFSATVLAPGIALFGFVMLMFSTAMALSRDRESALFSRLLTAPLRSNDFVAGYSLPYLPVAILQGIGIYAIGAFFDLEIKGSVILVAIVLVVMAVFYIALGMILGSTLDVAPISGAYAVILLLTIFGGAWVDLEAIGGVFKTAAAVFPFAHALDAVRDVMIDGAGFEAIAPDFLWVLAYTLASVALAIFLFRRKMVE